MGVYVACAMNAWATHIVVRDVELLDHFDGVGGFIVAQQKTVAVWRERGLDYDGRSEIDTNARW